MRPSATSAATRRSAAVSPSSRVRPPIRPSSARAPSDPRRGAELARSRRAPRRSRRGRRASGAAACGRRRARAARAPVRSVAGLLVLRDRLLEQRGRLVDAPRAAATRPRQRVTCASTRCRAERVASASQHRGLAPRRPRGRARAAPRRGRRPTSGLGSRQPSLLVTPSASREPLDGRARVAALQRDEAERPEMDGRVQPELLLAELQRPLRVRAGELELTAVGGDHASGRCCPRHLEPVLGDLVRARRRTRPRARQRPAHSSTQASSRARPPPKARRARATRGTRARAARAQRRMSPRRRSTCASCAARLLHAARVAAGGRELVGSRRVRRRLGSPTARPRNASIVERTDAERVVVELVGELERRSRVRRARREALLKRDAHASRQLDARLQRRPRLRLAQGLLEQRDGAVEPSSSARRRSASARSGPTSLSSSSSSRSSARASTRRRRDARGPQRALDGAARPPSGGVSRSARSASSAASADAPRSAASCRGVVEHRGDGGVGCLAREREVTGAGSGSSTISASRPWTPALVAEIV